MKCTSLSGQCVFSLGCQGSCNYDTTDKIVLKARQVGITRLLTLHATGKDIDALGELERFASTRRDDGTYPTDTECDAKEKQMENDAHGTNVNHMLSEAEMQKMEYEASNAFEFLWRKLPLIPPEALREVLKVLAHGVAKHGAEGWRDMDPPLAKARYYAHAQDHLETWFGAGLTDSSGDLVTNNRNEPESGLNHLAHAVGDLLILLAIDTIQQKEGE